MSAKIKCPKGFFAGIASMTFGAVSNVVTLWANSGYMPVHGFDGCKPGMVIDARHVCASSLDHLSLLTDRISAIGAIFSIGDLAMFFGLALTTISFMLLSYFLAVERV